MVSDEFAMPGEVAQASRSKVTRSRGLDQHGLDTTEDSSSSDDDDDTNGSQQRG